MSRYITNVRVEGGYANNGRFSFSFDADNTNHNIAPTLASGLTYVKFTMQDWNGNDANVDYVTIKINGQSWYTPNDNWWVNGDKSFVIPATYSGYSFNVKSSSATTQYITAYFHFEDGKGSEEYTIGTITYYAPLYTKLEIFSLPTTNFYLNETFTYNGLVTLAYYYWQIKGQTYTETISNPNVSIPDMSTAGSKYVSVSYGGKYTGYTITVHNVSSYSFGSTQVSYLKKGVDAVSTLFPVTLSITYSDSTTESQTITSSNITYTSEEFISGSNDIYVNVTVSTTAQKTGETITNTYQIRAEETTGLSITTQPTKKVYTGGESINLSGMVVKATYPNASTYTLSGSDYTYSGFDTSSSGVKTLTISYRNVSTTITYYVSGLISGTVDLSLVDSTGTSKYYKSTYLEGFYASVLNDLTTILGRIRMSYTTRTYQSNGTYTDSTAIAPRNEITISNNTLVKGDNTYTVTLIKNTITITNTFLLKTYKYESLAISGNRTTVYYGVNNTLQITPDLKVYGVDSNDNGRTELTYNTHYTVSPSVNTTYPLGNTTITFTSLDDTNISTSVNVNCIEDSPASGATLTASGSLDKTAINNKYYYSVGDTIGLDNLNLIVSEMASGVTNYILSSNMYEKRLYRTSGGAEIDKSNLTFSDSDTTGDYTLELSFGSLSVTYSIVLDYVDSVSVNTSTSKLVYKTGESLDISKIYGTATLASGNTRAIGLSDIAAITHTFDKEDKTDYDSETETLSLTICGISTNVTFTIICVKSLAVTLSSYSYNIHDTLSVSSIVVTYSDDVTTENLTTNDLTWSIDISDLCPSDIRTTSSYSISASYTKSDITVTHTGISISIKALKSIKIVDSSDNEYSIITKDYNTIIGDISNSYFLKAVFNDNTTSGIEIIDDVYGTNDSIITDVVLKNRTSCHIPYNWVVNNNVIDTLDVEFTIYCMKLVGLSLSWNGLNATHYTADVINMNVITNVVASYSALESGEESNSTYERTENLTYDDLTYTVNNQAISNFTYTFVTSGTYSLVASYSPYTNDNTTESQTLSISVEDVTLQSITKSYSGSNSFIENQTITTDGELEENLTVTAVYNNGNVVLDFEDLSFYTKSSDEYIPFVINKKLTLSDNNTDIYIGFGGEYVKLFTLDVDAKTLTSITVVEQPTKTTFTIGDVITLKGIIVRANFDNDTTDLLSLNDLVVTGVDTTNPITTIIEPLGRIATVSYTYGEVTKTAQVNLTLAYPKLASLRINTSYVTLVYKDGDTYSDSSLKVYAVMENGYEELLTTTNYSTDVSAFTSSSTISIPIDSETNKKKYGLTYIPVSATNPYDNTDTITNSTDYKITLVGTSDIEQTWLRFDDEVDYQNYNVGDIYNAKGLEMWVRDGANNEYKVNFTTNPAVGTILRSSQRISVVVSFENTQSQTYTINVSANYSDNSVDTTDYVIAIGDTNGNLFTTITHEDTEISLGVKNNGETIYPLFKAADVSKDTNIVHTNTYGFNVLNYQMSEAENRCVGYIDFGLQDEYGNLIKNAHVVLFDDYTNPVEGDGNVTVKFPHYTPGEADKVNRCKFGIIYNKHLFLSGNESYKNCDWHTENINIGQAENGYSESDYTYFSDLDYCYYGTDDTAIVGYDIYRDGDLVVIKESSRTQATLYRREAKIISAIDSQGNTLDGLYEDAYPCFDINFNGGDGGLSHRSIINFMGDTLFLTKNGLKVLSSKDTTYNKEKIVYDVSTYINPRILKENLENAYLYAFKEKLLLKTNRGVYVGEYILRNENNEYEWYFLSNINADLFFEFDDELYFMNDLGEFSKFSYDETLFKDNARTFIGVGGTLLSIDEANDYIITNQEYNNSINNNNEFHLIETDEDLIHASLGTFIETRERNNRALNDNTFNPLSYVGLIDDTNDTIEIKRYNSTNEYDEVETTNTHDLFLINRNVYIDNIVGVSINKSPMVDTPYKLVKVNPNNDFDYKYYLVNAVTNERAVLSQTKELRISFIISDGAVTRITNISSSGTGKKFQLLGDHNQVLDLINYNSYNGSYRGVITNQENVKAFYITKPYDMGTILYEKTVWQWAIINDTELASYMDIGYLTSRKQGDYDLVIKTASGSRAYSYDESKFSFDKIQFTSDKLPHIYNRYRVLANVGFMRFLFRNNEDSNIVLDQLSLIYTISQSIKGVR